MRLTVFLECILLFWGVFSCVIALGAPARAFLFMGMVLEAPSPLPMPWTGSRRRTAEHAMGRTGMTPGVHGDRLHTPGCEALARELCKPPLRISFDNTK